MAGFWVSILAGWAFALEIMIYMVKIAVEIRY